VWISADISHPAKARISATFFGRNPGGSPGCPRLCAVNGPDESQQYLLCNYSGLVSATTIRVHVSVHADSQIYVNVYMENHMPALFSSR